jgi:hypothetical protein
MSETRDPACATGRNRLIHADPESFRHSYNLRSFAFPHTLNSNPLFTLERLSRMAAAMLQRGATTNFVALGAESSSADGKFTSMPPRERLAKTVEELPLARSWLKLTNMESFDPEYRSLHDQLLAEIEQLSGVALSEQVTWSSLTAFLASPHAITPYHIDHESNFLFQIAGEKDLFLFDPGDRSLLSETEIEDFYAGNFQAARYREELQHRAAAYRLAPGVAAHHPPLAGHWVRNGDAVSVSVSLGFCMKPLDRRARVYQCNRFLRQLGLRPAPPGKSALRDGLKIASLGLLSKGRPTTPDEILYSGLNRLRRLAAPLIAARRTLRGARAR